ncbi:hypothetical protein OGAPHI_005574 [Ogataea philodendri]|uniref:Uncharacterized protein n=1 Tax=Ogataea philodendri TaxID=1378263 RepID=A0A9P8NYN5_9ASCO|nr:uncharacterized protein OGAPHI_005574 [Ogataea philodendri]KAH3662323.1 hypothetical protein OGAPHI_005574 [Ogataea philodendri]
MFLAAVNNSLEVKLPVPLYLFCSEKPSSMCQIPRIPRYPKSKFPEIIFPDETRSNARRLIVEQMSFSKSVSDLSPILSLISSNGDSSSSSSSGSSSLSLWSSLVDSDESGESTDLSFEFRLTWGSSSTMSCTIFEHVPCGPLKVRSLKESKSVLVKLSTTFIM